MNEPVYHHFLPQFYLRRWVGPDGRLCRFSKPYGDLTVAKRVSPKGTGGQGRLYSLTGAPADQTQRIEKGLMHSVDTLASDALSMLENGDPRLQHDAKYRSAWSRFVMSLMMRTPEDIAGLQQAIREEWARHMPGLVRKYEERRTPSDPPTFQEYLDRLNLADMRDWALQIGSALMDHQWIGNVLNNMRWFVRSIEGGDSQYLTSDRPVLMVDELASPEAFIMLPIGPARLFVAVHNVETQQRVEAVEPAQHIQGINIMAAGRAMEYVYGRDDSLRDFVQEHFGTRRRASLIDRLIAYRQGVNAAGGSQSVE